MVVRARWDGAYKVLNTVAWHECTSISDSAYHHQHPTAALRAGVAPLEHPSQADADDIAESSAVSSGNLSRKYPCSCCQDRSLDLKKVGCTCHTWWWQRSCWQNTAPAGCSLGYRHVGRWLLSLRELPVHLGGSRYRSEACRTLSRPQGPHF